MRIKAASPSQKQQAAQALNAIQAGQNSSGGELSLRQEFQAALDSLAGRRAGIAQHQRNQESEFAIEAATEVAALEPSRNVELLQAMAVREQPQASNDSRWSDPRPTQRNTSQQASADQEQPQREPAQKQPREQGGSDDVLSTDSAVSQNGQQEKQLAGDATATDVQLSTAAAPSHPTAGNQLKIDQVPTEQGSALESIPAEKMAPAEPTLPQANQGLPASKQASDGSEMSTKVAQAHTPAASGTQAPDQVASLEQPARAAENLQKPQQNGGEIARFDPGLANDSEGSDQLFAAINAALTQRLNAALQNGGTQSGASSREAVRGAVTSAGEANSLVSKLGVASVVAREGNATNGSLRLTNTAGLNRPANVSEREQPTVARQPRVQPSKLLERVEQTLKEAAKSRDGKTISLRLDPPELGTLKVDISLRDGGLHARIGAENAQVVNLLREKSYELQGMLRKLGLDAERITVSVHTQGGEFSQSDSNFGKSNQGDLKKERGFNNLDLGSGFASDTPARVGEADSGTLMGADGWVA